MLSISPSPPLYLSFLLFLSYHSPVLSCQTGTRSQCESAPFVPGHNLVGEGFDVITLRRKGAYMVDVRTYLTPNGTCTLCSNHIQGNKLQKLPLSAVDWRAYSRCNDAVHSSTHTSVSAHMWCGHHSHSGIRLSKETQSSFAPATPSSPSILGDPEVFPGHIWLAKEQQLYSKLPTDFRAPHPISKADPSTFKKESILASFKKLLSGKARGVDEICPEMLKALDIVGLSWLACQCCVLCNAVEFCASWPPYPKAVKLSNILSNYFTAIDEVCITGTYHYHFIAQTYLDVGGTHSSAYNFATEKNKHDRYTFSLHRVTCSQYSYRVSGTPPLSPEFSEDLKSLPNFYNSKTKSQYKKLIDTYGTHYIHKVYLGGRLMRIAAARTCLSTLNGLSSNEVHSCLSQGFSVGLGKTSASAISRICSKVLRNQDFVASSYELYQDYTEVLGGTQWSGVFSLIRDDSLGYLNWMKTLKNRPDIVGYSLRPMYELMQNESQRAQMKTAIEQYIANNTEINSHKEPYCQFIPNLARNCCPLRAQRGTLKVIIIRAWDLFGDLTGNTDGYVKLQYGSIRRRTDVVTSNNPWWNARYDLGTVDTRLTLKVEVWDDDSSWGNDDDLLVSCETYVKKGFHTFTCSSSLGSFKVEYTLTCDHHLTEDKCDHYTPSRQ
ncbi:perforin-1-like [Thunnus maccoyii]|uniref:perforin-1-like n=1 Tax=Thunnus maccoyii TaxID=8240 RepID=UPI001C4B9665|nr:perforin-1-like [Thunnus maccoyii]